MKHISLHARLFIGFISLLAPESLAFSQASQPPQAPDLVHNGWPTMVPGKNISDPELQSMGPGTFSDTVLPYSMIHESSGKIFSEDAALKAAMLAYAKTKARRDAFNQRYASLVIPEVNFNNATFASAVEYLKQQAEKSSGGEVIVNTVMLFPSGQDQRSKVSLDVRNIPFMEALRYICDQADADYTLEPYAIALTPRGSAPPQSEVSKVESAPEPISYLCLPRLTLSQSSLEDALAMLKSEAATISDGELKVNFVTHLPAGAKLGLINLNLGEIPFGEAFCYVCAQAGVDFDMDSYAIVVTGRGDDSPIQNGSVLPGVPVDSRVSGVIIPVIHIKQGSFSASLALLTQRVSQLTAGAASVNLVVKGDDQFGTQPINLDLSNVPFFAALRYVCYQAEAKFVVDKYAIIVSPANLPAAPPVQSASR
jgi:hypothetical protein